MAVDHLREEEFNLNYCRNKTNWGVWGLTLTQYPQVNNRLKIRRVIVYDRKLKY